MATSQNGWPVDKNRSLIGVTRFVVRDVDFIGGVKSGDVATVLRYVAEQFNDHVERFVNPGCWGWAYREIRGGSSYSNHASGTAIDFNAPKHPLGVENTFSPEQRRIGNEILASVDNVVRWGENYHGRVDGMHLEINSDASHVRSVANRLRSGEVALDEDDLNKIVDKVFNCTFTRQGNRGGHPEGSVTSLGAIVSWWDHLHNLPSSQPDITELAQALTRVAESMMEFPDPLE